MQCKSVARIWLTIKTPSINASMRTVAMLCHSHSHNQSHKHSHRHSHSHRHCSNLMTISRSVEICDRRLESWFMHALCFPPTGHLQIQITSLPESYIWQCLGAGFDVTCFLLRINWQPIDDQRSLHLAPYTNNNNSNNDLSTVSVSVAVPVSFPSLCCVAIPSNCLRHTSLACCHMHLLEPRLR